MLDIAKAASTGPVNLCQENTDFACLSFYKLFGQPTGLGALLVKRSTLSLLFKNQQKDERHYIGGGSLNVILSQYIIKLNLFYIFYVIFLIYL